MRTTIVRGAREAALAQIEALVRLYGLVFAEPPYHEGPEDIERFRQLLREEVELPGFTMVRALDGEALIGMAYGFRKPPGDWWVDAETPPAPALLDAPKFAVMEFAVHPDHRGRGLGRALLRELLHGRSEPFAALCVNAAAPAHAMYLRWGWRPAGRRVLGDRVIDILHLPLN
ncbi:GNAT family N-acetyltransferase [Nocardia sp. CDC159]|uniref:GNAT family N-acetyltransferase n=1 Tax=Nocardia pulmonis TaxID=2951408 RepID=A0A9X2IYQ6_9NOCA|nr:MULTISPECIES: GNAT family N-acetyltransferase [Nocardia]MCM6775255.1 GNAT family N-acetyltransferase [Nocardia pulmonis]MCM6788011.1 GNAT family N-acetyltransferase [Nocardia sp. CDC159]